MHVIIKSDASRQHGVSGPMSVALAQPRERVTNRIDRGADGLRLRLHQVDILRVAQGLPEKQLVDRRAARKRWKRALDNDSLARILELTRRHTYYVNLLCDRLWRRDAPPDIATVDAAWTECYHIERRLWLDLLGKLSLTKLALIQALALNPTTQPTQSDFLNRARVKKGSAWGALRELQDEDLIEEHNEVYRVLNPMLETVIRRSGGG